MRQGVSWQVPLFGVAGAVAESTVGCWLVSTSRRTASAVLVRSSAVVLARLQNSFGVC